MSNAASDAPSDDRNSDRDLLLGRVGRPGSSRKPAASSRKVNAPSGQADSVLLRENLQQVASLLERTAALEEAIRESLAVLERIAPAIDEFIRHSGDPSRELSKATAELSGVVSRLDGIEGKTPDAAEVMAPLRQDVDRLEERIGELARTLDSRDSEVADQVRLLGKMLTVRMDEVGRNLDGIRTKIGSADPFASAQKHIYRQDEDLPSPVPALAVPDLADPEAIEHAFGVLGDLHSRIGIGLFVLEQALPEADRKRAIAEFRRKHRDGPRRRRLRRLIAVAALVIVTAWIEATWHPVGTLLAWARFVIDGIGWIRFLTGWLP